LSLGADYLGVSPWQSTLAQAIGSSELKELRLLLPRHVIWAGLTRKCGLLLLLEDGFSGAVNRGRVGLNVGVDVDHQLKEMRRI